MMGNYRPGGSTQPDDVGDVSGRHHIRILSDNARNKAVGYLIPGIYSCMSYAVNTDFHMPAVWRLHEGLRRSDDIPDTVSGECLGEI